MLYIWMSQKNFELVSGLATSEEKYTDAVTLFNSRSMPARWHACFTIDWTFWRGALVEVWKTYLSFLPSLTRMPSAPRFHPAASRTWFALSTLNSHLVLGERKRAGWLSTLRVAIPVRP